MIVSPDLLPFNYVQDETFDGLALGLAFSLGAVNEADSETGFAHLVEHLIAKRAMASLDRFSSELETGDFSCEAKSYPFHTELVIHVSSLPRHDCLDLIAAGVTGILEDRPFSREEVVRETRIIDREFSFRVGDTFKNLVPWAFSRSIINPQGPSSDSFRVTNRQIDASLLDDLDRWKRRLIDVPRGVGFVLGPELVPVPDDLLEVLRLAPSRGEGIYSILAGAHGGLSQVTSDKEADPNTAEHAPLYLETYLGAPAEDSSAWSTDRGLSMLLSYVLRHLDPTMKSSLGFFGPLNGPDFSLLISAGNTPDLSSIASITASEFASIKSASVQSLIAQLSNETSAASLLSRDSLFGLHHEASLSAIRSAELTDVSEYLSRILSSPSNTHHFSMNGRHLV